MSRPSSMPNSAHCVCGQGKLHAQTLLLLFLYTSRLSFQVFSQSFVIPCWFLYHCSLLIVKILNLYIIFYMYSLESPLSIIYPFPAMHSLLVTIICMGYWIDINQRILSPCHCCAVCVMPSLFCFTTGITHYTHTTLF